MKRVFAFFVSLVIMFAANAADYRAVLVADIDSGRVLYQENANELNYPASLTKIMTLYLTFDALEHGRLHLDDYLIVSKYAADAQPVKLGLTAGSKIKVEDAIKAVAVHSANDVARVLAENLKGGKEGNFATLMTRVANEIGLEHTNFENSSGLPNDDHLSTARDIALLSMAVYKHFPQYWKYFGIKTWNYNGKTYTNGNRLLGTYPGCDGMKTGFTNKSKYSLVATAERGGYHLIAVVLGAENKDIRANAAAKMLNIGFKKLGVGGANYTEKTHTSAPTQSNPVVKYAVGDAKPVSYSGGNVGVQCGAFSSYESANKQAGHVYQVTGMTANVERNDAGLYRVRINGLSESAAQNIKSMAGASGIDCYTFH
ncbi:MAG: SPOR domain-containing protein [Alphaproteobacteria bacterium]|nr:SPOR domain-containing protein [Alphaproteobacteria bacterium]MBQ6012365.1 SPOR domain-containing protein [Alphaproteobacteria bacterium]